MGRLINGGLDWSHSHNSPSELSKLAVMDFTRTPNDIASTPLSINKTSEDGPSPITTLPQLRTTNTLG